MTFFKSVFVIASLYASYLGQDLRAIWCICIAIFLEMVS